MSFSRFPLSSVATDYGQTGHDEDPAAFVPSREPLDSIVFSTTLRDWRSRYYGYDVPSAPSYESGDTSGQTWPREFAEPGGCMPYRTPRAPSPNRLMALRPAASGLDLTKRMTLDPLTSGSGDFREDESVEVNTPYRSDGSHSCEPYDADAHVDPNFDFDGFLRCVGPYSDASRAISFNSNLAPDSESDPDFADDNDIDIDPDLDLHVVPYPDVYPDSDSEESDGSKSAVALPVVDLTQVESSDDDSGDDSDATMYGEKWLKNRNKARAASKASKVTPNEVIVVSSDEEDKYPDEDNDYPDYLDEDYYSEEEDEFSGEEDECSITEDDCAKEKPTAAVRHPEPERNDREHSSQPSWDRKRGRSSLEEPEASKPEPEPKRAKIDRPTFSCLPPAIRNSEVTDRSPRTEVSEMRVSPEGPTAPAPGPKPAITNGDENEQRPVVSFSIQSCSKEQLDKIFGPGAMKPPHKPAPEWRLRHITERRPPTSGLEGSISPLSSDEEAHDEIRPEDLIGRKPVAEKTQLADAAARPRPQTVAPGPSKAQRPQYEGSYKIECENISDYRTGCDNMTMDIYGGDDPESLTAHVDFGIFSGTMMFSSSVPALDAKMKAALEEERQSDFDFREDHGHGSPRNSNDNNATAPSAARQPGCGGKTVAEAQTGPPPQKLFYAVRGRLRDDANCPAPELGCIRFTDESLSVFKGGVAVPHYGTVFFDGRKVGEVPEKLPEPWWEYSDLAYQDDADYLQRVYQLRGNA